MKNACGDWDSMVGALLLVTHVVMDEALLGQLLILGAGLAIVGIGIDAYAATGSEETCHLYILGLHQADEVFHDDIDTVLMEVAVIAEAEEIELKALALYHLDIRDIRNAYLCKVGLPCDGAE